MMAGHIMAWVLFVLLAIHTVVVFPQPDSQKLLQISHSTDYGLKLIYDTEDSNIE